MEHWLLQNRVRDRQVSLLKAKQSPAVYLMLLQLFLLKTFQMIPLDCLSHLNSCLKLAKLLQVQPLVLLVRSQGIVQTRFRIFSSYWLTLTLTIPSMTSSNSFVNHLWKEFLVTPQLVSIREI